MEKLISCCGLDCATCEARIATINDDDKLRAETAEKWKVQFGAPDISIESINCTGCREPGVKLAHCNECKIRVCVGSKGFQTCADCTDLTTCEMLKMIHQYSPTALDNLKSLIH
jgi:hypothetical protein